MCSTSGADAPLENLFLLRNSAVKGRDLRLADHFRQNWIVDLALSAIVLIALLIRVAYATSNPVLDDAFITFRYVRNLARGIGFVYNPGEHVLGTTTPFYTLMLTPFALAGADIILVGKVINIVASAVNVILVFAIARREFGDWFALLAAMLLAISTSNVWAASTGMETELNVLILLAVAFAYVVGRYNAAAVLGAVAFMTRPDDLILLAVIAGWHAVKVIRRKHSFPFRPLAIFVLCLLPWMIFATIYFGSPIPSSVFGKAASYRVPIADDIAMYVEQYGFALRSARELIVTIPFVIGVIGIFYRRSDFVVFPIYFILYSAIFVLLGARLGSGWYWQPLWPVHTIIVAGGVGLIAEIARKSRLGWVITRFKKPIAAAVVLAVVLLWAITLKSRFIDFRLGDDREMIELEAAGRWINQNAASNATVGLETIGAVGWFSDRYIVDEGGLVSPPIAEINARIGKPDSITILRTFQPDYYLAWIHGELDSILSSPEQKEWFIAHYQPAATFDVGANRAPYFALFRKIPE
jgi:hypothetical protein